MSLIEQAAKRLEQLRSAGVEIPAAERGPVSGAGDMRSAAPPHVPEAMMQALEAQRQAKVPPAPVVPRPELPVRPQVAADTASVRNVRIDMAKLRLAGFLTPDTPRLQIGDEFRVIKRPLLANIQGKGVTHVARANLIMVTSALPAEGKTFVAINLAMSLAMEMDNTVLLVDADVDHPSILRELGLEPAKGLMDVLTDASLDLGDVLLRTDVEKLVLLPAGAAHGRSTELLASENMARLVAEMATRYPDRIIVFDGPPLLPTTESRVLAMHMGQIAMVVEADRTTKSELGQALATIESCPVVMTILNKSMGSEVGSYYGYRGYGNAE